MATNTHHFFVTINILPYLFADLSLLQSKGKLNISGSNDFFDSWKALCEAIFKNIENFTRSYRVICF